MKYFYGMRLRGFSPGCQPMDGFIKREDSSKKAYYDVLVYERPLTKEEVEHYSLTPLYGYIYTDNLGDEHLSAFSTAEEAVIDIAGVLALAFEEYVKLYPDCNVTWSNRTFDNGNVSEVYVPESDCYTRCELFGIA